MYFCKLCWDIIIYQNSHPRPLFAQSLSLWPLCWFKSYWWTRLLFPQSPCSHSLACCLIDKVLVSMYWAFDYGGPPTFHTRHTHTYVQIKHFCMVGAVARPFLWQLYADTYSKREQTRRGYSSWQLSFYNSFFNSFPADIHTYTATCDRTLSLICLHKLKSWTENQADATFLGQYSLETGGGFFY